jgi:hypothetical protein
MSQVLPWPEGFPEDLRAQLRKAFTQAKFNLHAAKERNQGIEKAEQRVQACKLARNQAIIEFESKDDAI